MSSDKSAGTGYDNVFHQDQPRGRPLLAARRVLLAPRDWLAGIGAITARPAGGAAGLAGQAPAPGGGIPLALGNRPLGHGLYDLRGHLPDPPHDHRPARPPLRRP